MNLKFASYISVSVFVTIVLLTIAFRVNDVKDDCVTHANHLLEEIAKKDSLIKILEVRVTPERKRGDLKSLKYRIYSIDRNGEVSSNELSEVLAEIVSEIEKLQKP